MGEVPTFDEYQKEAHRTAVYPPVYMDNGPLFEKSQVDIIYPTLGLVGEAGEIANKVKKVIRDTNGHVSVVRKNELAAELGDVLWYLAETCTALGVNLSKVAEYNLNKLAKRAESGTLKGSGDNR